MSAKVSRLDFSGQTLYVGVDVGRKSWFVSIYTQEMEHKSFCQPPDPEVLARYLAAQFPGATYRCVYEAGYSGFWPCEALTELGVDCLVVHPADVPTMHKERANRNDRVDARKLARGLRAGELEGIYVPAREAQEDRSLVRLRGEFVKKQTRCRNQIKAMVAFYGQLQPEPQGAGCWSQAYLKALQELEFQQPSGRRALDLLLQELQFLGEQIASVTAAIRSLAREERYREQVELLRTIPGISVLSAMILLTELIDIRRFGDLDHLAGYAGLKPGEDSSADTRRVTGLTRRRNARLRFLLIECSWMAVRKDPALQLAFVELRKHMSSCRAIVRIARKLLNRIRYVLKHREAYVMGVVR